MLYFHSIQSLSCVRFFLTPWTAAHQAFLSITNSWSLPKLMSIKTVMPSNHLIICHPLFLLPSMFPRIRVFSNESVLHIRWPKYFTQVFQSPSNDNSGLISFRFDCFDFLEVQGILKSLLQHHSSKASVLWHSAFFMVQISHSYISSVQSVSHVWLFVTLWTEAHQTSLPITNSWSLPKLMCIESVMPSNHLVLCHSPFPPTFNLSQHQGLFQWVSSLHQVASASASVLPVNIQDWFHLGWTGWISLQSKGLSRVFSNIIVQKHQFFGTQPSQSNSHIHTWLLEKP